MRFVSSYWEYTLTHALVEGNISVEIALHMFSGRAFSEGGYVS